jgi:BirA family biotin operon repressor/biotin-[acetyl-CoA-carboxylase] ligase
MRDPRLIGYARANRWSMSDAERLVWSRLRYQALGVKFRRQHPIGPYLADFACLSHRVVVGLDGSQHRPGYDRPRDAYMRRRGWTVLRFWAWDVVSSLEDVINTIANGLANCPHAAQGDDH